jgi:succinate dehydrogenase / fumarate reductase cytochrome b subunit
MPLLRFFRSTVGLKILMALTGVVLFGYVVAHMLGNLQIFAGPEQINGYGHFLHSQPGLLWSVRLFLLASLVIHFWTGYSLWYRNKEARPIGYATDTATKASLASRTMAVSGTIVLFFIIFHVLHFTLHTFNPAFSTYEDPERHPDVYRMVVTGFSSPAIAWFYVISIGLLCLHLSHGLSSLFRSLGIMNGPWYPVQLWFARVFATLIFVGMTSIPLAVQFGFVKLVTQP